MIWLVAQCSNCAGARTLILCSLHRSSLLLLSLLESEVFLVLFFPVFLGSLYTRYQGQRTRAQLCSAPSRA